MGKVYVEASFGQVLQHLSLNTKSDEESQKIFASVAAAAASAEHPFKPLEEAVPAEGVVVNLSAWYYNDTGTEVREAFECEMEDAAHARAVFDAVLAVIVDAGQAAAGGVPFRVHFPTVTPNLVRNVQEPKSEHVETPEEKMVPNAALAAVDAEAKAREVAIAEEAPHA